MTLLEYKDIDKQAWAALARESKTASWFQTLEAYEFYASLPEMFEPFGFAVANDDALKGICVGYITKEKSKFKQFFTRRAIVVGGPMLADDITQEQVVALMQAARNTLKDKVIYIETRNFQDYTQYKSAFQQAGFDYKPHLNFQVDTASINVVESNLSKSRKRDIRTSFRDGAQIIESPTLAQIQEWYAILQELYMTKVKTPLFPKAFFEQLYQLSSAHFLLVEVEGRIVGGTCTVGCGNKLYEWFVCGRDSDFRYIYPSTLATYAGIRYAAENGFAMFDMMGAGSPSESYGVRDFKAKFGGELVEYGRFKSVVKPMLYKCGEMGVKLLKKLK